MEADEMLKTAKKINQMQCELGAALFENRRTGVARASTPLCEALQEQKHTACLLVDLECP